MPCNDLTISALFEIIETIRWFPQQSLEFPRFFVKMLEKWKIFFSSSKSWQVIHDFSGYAGFTSYFGL